jgi:hypothetical protein
MDNISPAWLLLAVFVCSMIGRFMLIRAAWEISKAWGIAVLTVPFAPMVFRYKYKELASEGQGWRTATMILGLAFMGITGGSGSIDQLWEIVPEKLRPAEMQEHRYAHHVSQLDAQPGEPAEAVEPDEDEEHEEAPVAASGATPVAAPLVDAAAATANPALALVPKGFMGRIKDMVSRKSAADSGAAKPAAAGAAVPAKTATGPAAIATLTPPLTIAPTLSQRVAANQQEFARLAEVYESLKKEKGYLRKWDQDAIKAYNGEAAKYQAALAAARAEQVEINKQASLAKK